MRLMRIGWEYFILDIPYIHKTFCLDSLQDLFICTEELDFPFSEVKEALLEMELEDTNVAEFDMLNHQFLESWKAS